MILPCGHAPEWIMDVGCGLCVLLDVWKRQADELARRREEATEGKIRFTYGHGEYASYDEFIRFDAK